MEKNIENKLHNIWEVVYKIITPNWSWSSFYLKKYDVFVTNYHVVKWTRQLCIEDNEKNRHLWKVIFINPENDTSFIKVENISKTNIEIEISDNSLLNTRDEVFVLWYPFWLPFTITKWIISSKDQIINWKKLIQTDAAVNPWNSGWAMVDKNWKLIWVTVSKYVWENTDNIGFWVPSEFLIDDLESLSKKENDDFCIKCNSCKSLIYEKTSFCKTCWNNIEKEAFDEIQISAISKTIEEIINDLWINPIITRTNLEYWTFYYENKYIRINIDDDTYINLSSPIFKIPKENLDDFYKYSLWSDLWVYKTWFNEGEIFLLYKIHISDILWENVWEYITNIRNFFEKLKEVIKYLNENFKIEWSKYDKK